VLDKNNTPPRPNVLQIVLQFKADMTVVII
jgi:hypothetical protein